MMETIRLLFPMSKVGQHLSTSPLLKHMHGVWNHFCFGTLQRFWLCLLLQPKYGRIRPLMKKLKKAIKIYKLREFELIYYLPNKSSDGFRFILTIDSDFIFESGHKEY